MKKSKEYKICSTLFYISSILDYLIFIIGRDHTILWLCLGSLNFCLGSEYSEKSKKNKDDKDK